MRAEVRGDELLIVIDVGELPYRATARSLAAKLPRSASDIATEVVGMLDAPKPASGPVTVRAVTVELVRSEVVASETLMLSTERELFT
ncbi:MAG: hypothetical protein ACRDPY_32200 [Streptosporangiaceae bacterium]